MFENKNIDWGKYKPYLPYLYAAATLLAIFVIAFGILKIYEFSTSRKNVAQQKAAVPGVLPQNSELQLQGQTEQIVKTGDFNRCQEINDDVYRKVCTNNIALNLAQQKLDSSYCQKIDGKLMSAEECDRRVMGEKMAKATSIAVCQQALTDTVKKECEDNFYSNSGFIANSVDINACSRAPTTEQEDDCYDSYLFQKEFSTNIDGFQCDKFHKQQTQADCKVYQGNYKKPDFNPCQSLKSKEFMVFCFLSRKR